MEGEGDGIHSLILSLSDAQLNKELKRRNNRDKDRKKLKRTAYEAIFSYLKQFRSSQYGNQMTVVDQLHVKVFQLRCQRKFDSASNLEVLIAKLLPEGSVDGTTCDVLRFLFALQDSEESPTNDVIGHLKEFPHTANVGQMKPNILPDGPLMYGDTRVDLPSVYHYMQFSSDVFEGNPAMDGNYLGSSKYSLPNNEIFNAKPRSQLPLKQLSGKHELYENQIRRTLFGALVQSRTDEIDICLDIPELPASTQSSMLDVHIPSGKLNEISEDEGFVDNLSTSSGRSLLSPSASVWELALNHKLSRHHTWENVGRQSDVKEKPFITEASGKVFDKLRKLHLHRLQLMDPRLDIPVEAQTTQKNLVKDVINLLIGVPSHSFTYAQGSFSISAGLLIVGLSTELVHQACSAALQAGSSFHSLGEFSQPRIPRSTESFGLILESFRSAIRTYLQRYRACILSVSRDSSLLKINCSLRKVMNQICFLADLCMCGSGCQQQNSFPTGVDLLTYLYDKCLALDASSEHRPVMMSLFRTSCSSYFALIEEWVFYGLCRDKFGEFMLEANENYLRYRDHQYWSKGFVLVNKDTQKNVPSFLADTAYDVYVCGKSLNLLRLCNPQHFLFTELSIVRPRVNLMLSKRQLLRFENTSLEYQARMEVIARQSSRTRSEMKQRNEQAKQELIQRARRVATQEIERLQGKILESKKKADIKKRQLFTQLKVQMEEDLKRRDKGRKDQREEDKRLVDSQTRQELLEAGINNEMEKQLREELVEYYSKLSADAVRREQKALWKIRRHRLNELREKFLQADDLQIEEELFSKRLQGSGSSSGTIPNSNLPAWATKGLESLADTVPLVPSDFISDALVTDLDQQGDPDVSKALTLSDLPSWAKKALESVEAKPSNLPPPLTVQLIVEESTTELPSWAQKAIQGELSGTILVEEGQEVRDTGGEVDSQTVVGEIHTTSAKEEKISSNNLEDSVALKDVTLTIDDLVSDEKEIVDESCLPQKKTSVSSGTIERSSSEHLETSENAVTDSEVLKNDQKLGHGSDTLNGVQPSQSLVNTGSASGISDQETDKPNQRSVRGAGVTVESEYGDTVVRPHLKSVHGASAMLESESDDRVTRPHLKSVQGASAMLESESDDRVTRPHLKSVHGASALLESESDDRVIRPHLKSVQGASAMLESESDDRVTRPHLKSVQGASALLESESDDRMFRPHSKTVLGSNIDDESERDDRFQKPHSKQVLGMSATTESETDDRTMKSHLKMNDNMNATKESQPVTVSIKRQNVYGHISQISRYDLEEIVAPRLKRNADVDASTESSWSDFCSFQVRVPRRKKVDRQSVDRLADDSSEIRSQIRFSGSMNALTESVYVDSDSVRNERFRNQNIHGHSSDSSIQLLLYGKRPKLDIVNEIPDVEEHEAYQLLLDSEIEPYKDEFDRLDNSPEVNLLASFKRNIQPREEIFELDEEEQFVSLPVLIKKSITVPLLAQISIVSQSLVDYFMVDLEIETYFVALQRFLLLQDGEFSQSLCDQLFDKLITHSHSAEILNPAYLNNVLYKALAASIHGDSLHADKISFIVKEQPVVLSKSALDALDCVGLMCRIDWPLNVVINDKNLADYCLIFNFQLKLKRVVWLLKDVFHRLKRDAVVYSAGNSDQMRILQLYRHEMQHFVKVIQEYVANQVMDVSWHEFQEGLSDGLKCLDDLIHCHNRYIGKCLARCLLNKKASPVMTIITDVFGLILMFHGQLTSHAWQQRGKDGLLQHPAFEQLQTTYKKFHNHSSFLYKVLGKLAQRGYQAHLQELLLRLNFNGFYRPIGAYSTGLIAQNDFIG